jgi:flagella basal body P-ring formation protein FlgA
MKSRASLLPIAFLALCAAAPLRAEEPVSAALAEQARVLALDSSRAPDGLRVEVEAGTLDPRLKLAPCERIEPYLPPGFKAWGRTRVGLRCLQGAARWNVFLPLTVRVYGRALVAATALPAGAVLGAADLREAEVDLAADASPALTDTAAALGRVLTRALNPGEALRQQQLRPRQWFASGDTVRLVALGAGFAVQGEGQAIGPGLDGQPVRVRTDSGRIVSGVAVGERRVELRL